MDQPAREPSVPAIVEAIATRSEQDSRELAAVLHDRCWPRGVADRSEPSALDWVRRWGPSRLTAEPIDCSCSHGRCAVCN
jgi:hypothetical protein